MNENKDINMIIFTASLCIWGLHVHFFVACKLTFWLWLDGKFSLNSLDTILFGIWLRKMYLVVMEQIHMLENGSGGIEGQCLYVSVCEQSRSFWFSIICFKLTLQKKPAEVYFLK